MLLKTDYKTNNHSPPHAFMPMRKTKSFESYDETGFLKIDCQQKISPIPMFPSKCSHPYTAAPMKILSLKTDYKTNNHFPFNGSMPNRKIKPFESYNEKCFMKIDCQKKLLLSPCSHPEATISMLPCP